MNSRLPRGRTALGVLLAAAVSAGSVRSDAFREGFSNPSREFGLQAWYHWVGDYVTEKGLAADIAAMDDFGICAAHIFGPGHCPLPGKETPGTDLWFDRVEFAAKEAAKHGIALGAHNCPGWSSSGGPWIKPEDSMKIVVSSQVDAHGGSAPVRVPPPPSLHGFYRDIAAYAFPVPEIPAIVSEKGALDVFSTWMVEYAAPWCPKSFSFDFTGVHLWGRIRVSASPDGLDWEELADLKLHLYRVPQGVPCIYDLPAAKRPCRFYKAEYLGPWPVAKTDRWPPHLTSLRFEAIRLVQEVHRLNGSVSGPEYRPQGSRRDEQGLSETGIIEVAGRALPDGSLECSLPPAASPWRIVRLGYTTTGAVCRPASRGATGLECDKLSRRGLDAHWPHMPARFTATSAGRAAFRTLTIDSYEQPGQSWTEDFPQEFLSRRGYPIGKRLLCVVGYPVGSWRDTAKFLYDYSRTVSDLFADNYYGYFTELCHKAGLKSVAETYGAPCDIHHAASLVDIPAGEIWDWKNGDVMSQFCTLASSAAHLSGKTGLAAAEAFTSFSPFARYETTPADLFRRTDDIWSRGINDIIYHSYVHQPWMNVKPGTTLGTHGAQLNRYTTWWKEGRGWSDYVRRGQYLLRAGYSCPDLLVFAGETHSSGLNIRIPGVEHDLVGSRDLWRLENTPDGRLRLPGSGTSYPALFMGYVGHVTIRTLEAMKRLLDGGASIAATPPTDTPSLSDDLSRWKELRESIWGTDAKPFDGVRIVGKGRLVCASDVRAAMSALGLEGAVQNADTLARIHRRSGNHEIYYLYNRSTNETFCSSISFAIPKGLSPAEASLLQGSVPTSMPKGLSPEIWDARTGVIKPLLSEQTNSHVSISLKIQPNKGMFVVFSPLNKGLSPQSGGLSPQGEGLSPQGEGLSPRGNEVVDISKEWMVEFSGLGAPKGIFKFPVLASWSEHEIDGIRYLAGHGIYRRKFVFARKKGKNTRWTLDLGEVRDVASVSLNGGKSICLLEPPYRIDATDLLVQGENTIEIDVVNCWPNRLIGDARARASGRAPEPRSPLGNWPDWVIEDKVRTTAPFTWSTYRDAYSASDALLPAGMLGPVILRPLAVRSL